jgi:biotin carboxylase
MQGPEISVETITIKGKTSIIAITDKLTTGSPYFVEMGHSQPTQHGPEIKQEIENVALKAIKSIGIETGAAHVEMIITDHGPKLVELGARLAGDCIASHLVPLSTGVDLVKACIELSLGLTPDIRPNINKGAAIRYLDSQEGIFGGVSGIVNAEKKNGVKKIEIVKNIGDKIKEVKGSGDRVGFVIVQSETAKSAIDECNDCLKLLDVLII